MPWEHYRGIFTEPQLEAIGFNWTPTQAQHEKWQAMYERLKAYQVTYGHCNVPRRWPENPALGHWVASQRQRYQNGELTDTGRIQQLTSLGFEWTWRYTQALWDEHYEQLKAYHAQHGSFAISPREDKTLHLWVNTQREKRRKGTLLAERVKRLEAIGFDWKSGSRRERE